VIDGTRVTGALMESALSTTPHEPSTSRSLPAPELDEGSRPATKENSDPGRNRESIRPSHRRPGWCRSRFPSPSSSASTGLTPTSSVNDSTAAALDLTAQRPHAGTALTLLRLPLSLVQPAPAPLLLRHAQPRRLRTSPHHHRHRGMITQPNPSAETGDAQASVKPRVVQCFSSEILA
jgi:hypothetical protein